MRTSFLTLIAGIMLAACSSGTRVIVIREPSAAPAPRPAPQQPANPIPTPVREVLDPLEPLEVTIGRPYRGHIFVHTNRPAYIAIFEIIPERATVLVRPASVRERRMVVSGLARIPVWWEASAPGARGAAQQASTPPGRAQGRPWRDVRYIYVLAADRPIKLDPEIFRDGYLQVALGPSAYRATNPYATMRALARRFAPDVIDERWAEDVYVVEPSRASEPQRVARIYCAGAAHEIPEELADRTWCPRAPHIERDVERPANANGVLELPAPEQPDSVKGNNGRRVQRRAHGDPVSRTVKRVQEPPAGAPGAPGAPGDAGRAERERVEREKAEKERIEKEKAEAERAERERIERERIERERVERERVEKEKLEKERLEKEKLEKERLEREKLERERLEKDKLERERAEREKAERERAERERAEREKAERDRAAKERPGHPPANAPANPPVTVPAQTPVTTPGGGTPGKAPEKEAAGKPANGGTPGNGDAEKGKPASPKAEPGKPDAATETGKPAGKPDAPAEAKGKAQGKPKSEVKPDSAAPPDSGKGKPAGRGGRPPV